MYGSPAPTSQAQYPIGTRTWFKLKMVNAHQPAKTLPRAAFVRTYPAAAMSAKSASVIQVSQWASRAAVAISRS
jgi:hypothetical protein